MFEQTDAAMARRMAANRTSNVPLSHEPEMLAQMAHSVTHSIMTRARAGASRQELTQIAESFMAVLFPPPGCPKNRP
jgi:hypothetical protein